MHLPRQTSCVRIESLEERILPTITLNLAQDGLMLSAIVTGDGSGATTPLNFDIQSNNIMLNDQDTGAKADTLFELNVTVHASHTGAIEMNAGELRRYVTATDPFITSALQIIDVTGGVGDDLIDIRGSGVSGGTVFGAHAALRASGGAGNDTIVGSFGKDRIRGGDDIVYGQFGADILMGDMGSDLLDGDDGNDQLLGAGGDDTLKGGAGDDSLTGNSGNNVLEGGAGIDTAHHRSNSLIVTDTQTSTPGGGTNSLDAVERVQLLAESIDTIVQFDASAFSGDTFVVGGVGRDVLIGGSGRDVLIGGGGSDAISGGAGDDLLVGASGRDTIDGGSGNDLIFGGNGRDVLIGGLDSDTLQGQKGNDKLYGTSLIFDVDNATDFLFGGPDTDEVFAADLSDVMI